MNEVPHFDEAQKKYFQQQLAAQSGKSLNLAPELMTDEQRATVAHETADLETLKDPKIRHAYLAKFGVDEFSRLHLRATRERRERERRAEEARLLEQTKARRGRI